MEMGATVQGLAAPGLYLLGWVLHRSQCLFSQEFTRFCVPRKRRELNFSLTDKFDAFL